MARGTAQGAKPQGCARLLLRAPVWLYRFGLGWLLGRRFLMVEHRGRRTGKPRYAVLEVVRHDHLADSYVVASGWGRKADWYRNVRLTPEVRVTVGVRRFDARALPLPIAEATRELCEYARAHPAAFRALAGVLLGRGDVTCEQVAKLVPVLVLTRRAPPGP
jgi:deazaflavin-dependent oxidoreductase (nitroreductase family)